MHRLRTTVIAATVALSIAGATMIAAGRQVQAQQGQDQGQRDEAAARAELQQAKQALTDLIALPETSKLNAEARSAINQVITSFNNLVTAEINWLERYQEVQRSLTPVLGPEPANSSVGASASSGATGTSGAGASGATGTTGSSGAASPRAAAVNIDVPPALKERLTQFRAHMQAFARAAGAPAAGMSGTQERDAANSLQAGDTMREHLDAIGDLLQQALGGQPGSSAAGSSGSSTTGTSGASGSVTIDRATLQQMQAHLQKLREIARAKGIR